MHSLQYLRLTTPKSLAELINLNAKERVLSYLPLAHIVERAGMEGTAIYLGYRIFFSEGIDTFLADLARARPTIFLSVPRLLLKFQQGVFAKMPGAQAGTPAAHPHPESRRPQTRPAASSDWIPCSTPPAAPPRCPRRFCCGTASSA